MKNNVQTLHRCAGCWNLVTKEELEAGAYIVRKSGRAHYVHGSDCEELWEERQSVLKDLGPNTTPALFSS